MLTREPKLLTHDFIRVRVLWIAVCLASLALWYVQRLWALDWPRRVGFVVSPFAVTGLGVFLAPRLKSRLALTLILTVAVILVLAWLGWSSTATVT